MATKYMKAQIGSKAKPDIAQNGILRRSLAAFTYAGSGFSTFTEGAAEAFAGAADSVLAGVELATGVPPDASPEASARRALERFRRCSGISVTANTSIGGRIPRPGGPERACDRGETYLPRTSPR